MDHPVVLFLLRAIHILAGIAWVGGVVLVTLFVLPAARAVGPAAQPMMQHMMERARVSVYLIVVANLTLLAGLALYGHNMALTHGAWAHSPMGIGMTIGALSAIVAMAIGMFVTAPAAKKLSGGGATPLGDEERARLQVRLTLAARAVLVLLAIAATLMATARYF
ncbi:MAG TPA: hypothetical protein VL328_16365 [Gemmatimonadaceae bacterium]|jgi:uncharacterized membrane protein|nr:hypothetical protein [Gemmatimonadaceae bacterium]